MKRRTLKALRGSIEKWEEILTGYGIDHGRDNCPLCKIFSSPYRECNAREGERCPVKIHSKRIACRRTPYQRWSKHHMDVHFLEANKIPGGCPKCKQLAQKEIDFLKSLLPSKPKKKEE